jgi:hypothetical protein
MRRRTLGLVVLVLVSLAAIAIPAQVTLEPVASPKPIAVIIERNPWLMVIGSDPISLALFPDGTLIFRDMSEKGGYKYRKVQLEKQRFEKVKSELGPTEEFLSLKEDYNIAQNATDLPTVEIGVANDTKGNYVSIYGYLPEKPFVPATTTVPSEKSSDPLPKEFDRVYKYLMALTKGESSQYAPPYLEVMIWPYEYAPDESLPWPAKWPDTKSAYAVKRGESYSIFLPGSMAGELDAFISKRKEKGAILVNEKKWAISYRPIVPGDPAWGRVQEMASTMKKRIS